MEKTKPLHNIIKTLLKITPDYNGVLPLELRSMESRISVIEKNFQRYKHDPKRFLRKIAFCFDRQPYLLIQNWLVHGLGQLEGFQDFDFSNPTQILKDTKEIIKKENIPSKSYPLNLFLKKQHQECWFKGTWSMKKTKKNMGANKKSNYPILKNCDFMEYCYQQRSHPNSPEWKSFFEHSIQYNPEGVIAWLGLYVIERAHAEPSTAWATIMDIDHQYHILKELDPTLRFYDFYHKKTATIQEETVLWM